MLDPLGRLDEPNYCPHCMRATKDATDARAGRPCIPAERLFLHSDLLARLVALHAACEIDLYP
jgi:hypothetical protein